MPPDPRQDTPEDEQDSGSSLPAGPVHTDGDDCQPWQGER